MYYIRKYSNGWAIHNDDNGEARLLNDQEVEAVKQEFPDLQDEKVATVFADEVKSIKEKP
ncbi:MAG: hypothetical protein AB7K37_15410 [Cyclobacteriaceae bacterium]|jgi:hypothetical protein